MDLSLETPTNQQSDSNSTYKRQKIDSLRLPSNYCQTIDENDIIDLSKLNLNDDENWLLESSNKSDTDLQKWLYFDDYADDLTRECAKNIDTRTFTRPKKRFVRPSIEKYNEELYGGPELATSLTDSGIQLNGCSQTEDRPVHFDLAQPVSNSYYFDNILASAGMADSFQNMSPPSLVNSMCSSTFANLMESSVIKNDPVLKEIRDTDFTGLALQQEAEPMFQSITESCSSLNSDVAENLLKKISFNENNSSEASESTIILNTTFAKNNNSSKETVTLDYNDDLEFEEAKVPETLNTTFNQRVNGTYQEINNATIKVNSTFQRRKSNRSTILANNPPDIIIKHEDVMNQTVTIENKKQIDDKPIETKRLLDRRPSPSLDLNRLSYVATDKNTDRLNHTYTNIENTKRNSLESSDSTENLDYMSLSSGSSKISSTDGINDERSLQQIMSTPKPKSTARGQIPWHNSDISPISGRNSDPELSSTEAKPAIMANAIKKQKSTGNIASRMPPPRSIGTLSRVTKGSQPNLRMPEPRGQPQQRTSNLNSMGHTLKGSYTSLKPMNPNLPVAPPPLDTTVTLPKATAQVSPPRESAHPKNENAQFVKPQPFKSALPRPVTGIPRPVSRIPGPRGVRPVSKSAGQQGRQTNHY